MRIQLLDPALEDILDGYHFYESQRAGVGDYFLDCLYSDIDSLILYAGIHPVKYGYHWMLAKRFPYAIYYTIENNSVVVHAILDCRQNPEHQRKRLR